jgi:hypothetical protein
MSVDFDFVGEILPNPFQPAGGGAACYAFLSREVVQVGINGLLL